MSSRPYSFVEKTPSELMTSWLYPPESDSAILEVSTEAESEFLWVAENAERELVFSFFGEHDFSLTESQFDFIKQVAREKFSL
jgi:hypothetical protein